MTLSTLSSKLPSFILTEEVQAEVKRLRPGKATVAGCLRLLKDCATQHRSTNKESPSAVDHHVFLQCIEQTAEKNKFKNKSLGKKRRKPPRFSDVGLFKVLVDVAHFLHFQHILTLKINNYKST